MDSNSNDTEEEEKNLESDESSSTDCFQLCNTEYNDIDDFKEFICELIETYVVSNLIDIQNPDFEKNVMNETIREIKASYYNIIDKINEEQLIEIVNECCYIYFNVIYKPRSYETTVSHILEKDIITKQINKLRKIPQPQQNTPEWFDFRWTKLTASSAYKTFGSEASYNSLIYSKCKPIDTSKFNTVNITSATHHGHKFEDISVQIYENMFNTTIEEFGCIADDEYDFIGASPDGINVKKNNNKYGYLLEIKNPVSRKLTGIPKLDYWVQMQQQMYVTKLPYCDFLETVIKDYENEEAFKKDGSFTKTATGNVKGIIVCFNDGEKPIYKYPKLGISEKKFNAWYDDILEKNKNLTWVNNTYWFLQEFSCVTVPYHEKWFELAIPKFKEIWDIILKERKEGYGHRKPKKKRVKVVKDSSKNVVIPQLNIKFNDIIKTQNDNLKNSKL